MSRRRKTQWIDALSSTEVAVAGGAISNVTQVTEAELENLGGGMTLVRVIGDILPRVRASGGAVVQATFNLFMFEPYAGGVQPTVWDIDTYQRRSMLGTWMWRDAGVANQAGVPRSIHVDLRTKRKIGQGERIELATATTGTGGVSFFSHLRFLFLLP